MKQLLLISKALADESRLRALMALREGELCLCQLIDLLGLAPSTVSRHMTQLSQAGLVERRKEGKWHFYRLAEAEAPTAVRRGLDWALSSLADDPALAADQRRLLAVRRKDLGELSACYRT